MTGNARRETVLKRLKAGRGPVSGKALAEEFGVSRQVIVQDIALLRASGAEILSTNRGYILTGPSRVSRVFKVRHDDDRIEEELNGIVDMGGTIDNVMVRHRVYGEIDADLNIRSRKDVRAFMEGLKTGKSRPLKKITSDYHYHRVEADSEETLDAIEAQLKDQGFLLAPDDWA